MDFKSLRCISPFIACLLVRVSAVHSLCRYRMNIIICYHQISYLRFPEMNEMMMFCAVRAKEREETEMMM